MTIFQNYPPIAPKPRLSFGVERIVIQKLSELQEFNEQQFIDAVTFAYRHVYDAAHIEQNLQHLMARVAERVNELNAQSETSKPIPVKGAKTLGSAYSEWLGGLDSTEACLFLTDFDIERAIKVYWFEDVDVVQHAIKLKGEHNNQQILASFEAGMYAAGGKYSGDGEKGATYRVDSGEGAAALKSLGF